MVGSKMGRMQASGVPFAFQIEGGEQNGIVVPLFDCPVGFQNGEGGGGGGGGSVV